MDERLVANRENWDDRVPIHAASEFYDVDGWLAGDREPRPWELEVLGDVSGLDVVHLQCHFGLDTLSLAHAGARVTGLDFSPAAIATARDLAERSGLAERARFVEADVHAAAQVLAPERFDLVYVSLGALCWLPSVAAWAGQVRALLRPGGRLFLHEAHPLSFAMMWTEPTMETSYFEEVEPYVDDDGHTYTDGEQPIAHARNYQWNHGLAEVVTAVLDQGLRLDRLEEHDWTSYERFEWLEERRPQRYETPPGHIRMPLSFTLVASLPQH
jgi:SAM-dependent methyltransferase